MEPCVNFDGVSWDIILTLCCWDFIFRCDVLFPWIVEFLIKYYMYGLRVLHGSQQENQSFATKQIVVKSHQLWSKCVLAMNLFKLATKWSYHGLGGKLALEIS